MYVLVLVWLLCMYVLVLVCLLVLQSKRRGLSVEEKRTRLLELFFEKVRAFLPPEIGILCHSI